MTVNNENQEITSPLSPPLSPTHKSHSLLAASSSSVNHRKSHFNFEIVFISLAIILSLVTYGILQEKIITTTYGPDKAFFEDSNFLVLSNRICAVLLAAIALAVYSQGSKSLKPEGPLLNYAMVSVFNLLATLSQYESLKYVSFPTQTLGKCAKMIPTLLVGSILLRKCYTWRDYVVALGVTLGCTLFLTSGAIKSKISERGDTPIGLILICVYLLFDALTSNVQEKLFSGYNMHVYDQMLYVSLFSLFFSLCSYLPNPNRFLSSLQFCYDYPDFVIDVVILSLSSSVGQVIIYYTIKKYDALTYSTIMTTRQFLSICLSSLLFLNALSFYQWVGGSLVLLSLYTKAVLSHRNRQSKSRPSSPTDMTMQEKALLLPLFGKGSPQND